MTASRGYSNGYCEYPPAPAAPPGHVPAWKAIPPSRRWDAYRQIAAKLPAIVQTEGSSGTTLDDALWGAPEAAAPRRPAFYRWTAWLRRELDR